MLTNNEGNNLSSTSTSVANTNQSSLLLNSVNLAWSQPAGCVLVAPKPSIPSLPESPVKDLSSTTNTENSPVQEQVATSLGQLNLSESQQHELQTYSTNQESVHSNYALESTQASYDNQTASYVQSSPVNQNVSSPELQSTSLTNEYQAQTYQEVSYHWYYQPDPTSPDVWQAFSTVDSFNLESYFLQGLIDNPVPTNGTRFDVCIRDRIRKPVYWNGPENLVQRCSWFYKKDSDYRSVPYSEYVSNLLENVYRESVLSNTWNRRIDISDTDFVYFYASNSIYHYVSDNANVDGWTGMMSDSQVQPKYVYRGIWLNQSQMERDECVGVDHLIFMVHGIGNFCDISFRKLVDVVDDFRELTHELLQSHYGTKTGGRVEVLPISWHDALHTETLDSHLKLLTLSSVPRMRSFTNDTILDALFYTSAQHSQTILNAVASELNRLYSLFISRNSHFSNSVSLVGHSLGSLILFDLLSHQVLPEHQQQVQFNPQEQLPFCPNALFALGSPIPVFLTVRGVDSLDPTFQLPTCRAFYNIFHPFDPIAYRFEPLINKEFAKIKPVLIPHHKGRKRFHLELRDSIARVGTDLKQKFMTSVKATLNSIYGFARSHRASTIDEQTVDDNAQNKPETEETEKKLPNSVSNMSLFTELVTPSIPETSIDNEENSEILRLNFGRLNSGRRIDHVLQERPIELMNEYVFAIATHGCYWLSEDTSLLILKELYGQIGLLPNLNEDSQSTDSLINATELAQLS